MVVLSVSTRFLIAFILTHNTKAQPVTSKSSSSASPERSTGCIWKDSCRPGATRRPDSHLVIILSGTDFLGDPAIERGDAVWSTAAYLFRDSDGIDGREVGRLLVGIEEIKTAEGAVFLEGPTLNTGMSTGI
jgi:hypothetical protein